jgi:hypothetical protein
MKRAGKRTVRPERVVWWLSPYFIWLCCSVDGLGWRAAGLDWRASGVVLSPFHQVGGLDSSSRYSDLPAPHDNFKCFVGAR